MIIDGFGAKCTVEDFYLYMKEHHAEKYQMTVQYRDEGGDYNGEDEEIRCQILHDRQTVVL